MGYMRARLSSLIFWAKSLKNRECNVCFAIFYTVYTNKPHTINRLIMDKTVLEVSALENGTVIDHIPAGSLFKIINILSLDDITNRITFGTNLESKRIGTKAIIKIADMEVDKNDLSRIALFAPEARMSYIKDFEVSEKINLEVPDRIEGTIRCANPMCITNQEKVTPSFSVVNKLDIALRCHYCEKITTQQQFEIIE